MMSKEEKLLYSLSALKSVIQTFEIDVEVTLTKDDNKYTINAYKEIERFIVECINNTQPLKFEELEEGMWVWDDAKKRYLKIKGITSDCLGRAIVKYQNGYENDNHYYLTEFEKNRFYRKQVEE